MTTLSQKLNAQIRLELKAAYTYQGMAVYLESENLKGMASWMKAQAQEERNHADKIIQFMLDVGWSVDLGSLPVSITSYESPKVVFEYALDHEKMVTAAIHDIYNYATKEATEEDTTSLHRVANMLLWFIDEQIEEEATATEWLEKIQAAGDNYAALLIIDDQMGNR